MEIHDSRFKQVTKELAKNGVVIIFISIVIIIALLTNGKSIKMSNILNILVQTTTTGLISIGMTLVIIDRGIDLSVGGIAALSSAVGAICMKQLGFSWGICILIMLLIGLVFGLLNGLAVALLRMPAFICTMAMLQITRGSAHFLLGGTTVYGLPEEHSVFGQGTLLHIPLSIWILVLFTVSGAVFLKYTRFGRELYAMGGNPKAAWIAGINVNKNRIMIYVISGFMSAVAALIITSRIMCAQITIGEGIELDAIASAVIGGVSMAGGEGGVIGTVVGALIIVMVNNGLNLLAVSPYIQTAIKGLVIFSAITADLLRRRKQLKNS